MKTYTITNKRDDAVIIRENNTLVEISAQIDSGKVEFKHWHGKIEYHARLLTSLDDTLARWVGWESYITPQAYNAATKQLRNNLLMVKIDLANASLDARYARMEAIVNDHVKSFKTDFTYHDALHLSRMPGREFIWIVRESGTWYLSTNESHEILDYCLKHNPEALYFHVTQNNVKPITGNQAKEILARL